MAEKTAGGERLRVEGIIGASMPARGEVQRRFRRRRIDEGSGVIGALGLDCSRQECLEESLEGEANRHLLGLEQVVMQPLALRA
jgi:hypothetical protein